MPILLNRSLVQTSMFAGGECHVSIEGIPLGDFCKITAKLISPTDIMQLLLVVDAVRRCKPGCGIDLIIPYFPYARQDRVCNPGEALSVKVMAGLINSLQVQRVTVFDPHSDVTSALLENCVTVSQAEIISKTSLRNFISDNKLVLLSPDAGAEKKSRQIVQSLAQLGLSVELYFGAKQRDSKSGEIKGVRIHGELEGKSVLIVDDICDGGRTFIELSNHLRKIGAKKLYLYTTHGIYARGLETLKQHFDHMFCFHDMRPSSPSDEESLTVLENEFTV